MTFMMHGIVEIIDTLEVIESHAGQKVSEIARDIGFQGIIGRINEMIRHGLADKMGSYTDGYKHVYLTPKGREILDMLRQVQDRLDSDEGEDELIVGEKIVKMTWRY